ncbi:hypothetical protein [Encephalitozoon cuniculi GB-M1]|uniref:DUF5097 domain-containing protein n=1 Tax=Encephalitozoon cuniculi (strain GB-M1) TaxID=284813 RepID=Q8SU84_ENCCU|nr:uncharacterized protein ECU11_0260 [Encephalitozoon cuniculi GB-M1]CAD25936.1 hypothetical protein [Encephalitozoon cuniculi GB-M1]
MIESPAIKRFVVDYFIEHSQEDIDEMVASIHRRLLSGFVVNEDVCVVKSGECGRVVGVLGPRYAVMVQSPCGWREEDFELSELARREGVSGGRIRGYLLGITMETPFGRVLKENAFRSIRDSQEVMRCRVPQSQCCEAPNPVPGGSSGGRGGGEEQGPGQPGSRGAERQKGLSSMAADVESILRLSEERIVSVEGLGPWDVEAVMKIFGALATFGSVFRIRSVDAWSLASAISDPAYGSDMMRLVHEKLVGALRRDIEENGMDRFVENVRPCVGVAVEAMCSAEGPQDVLQGGQQQGPVEDCGKEGWKDDLREFIGCVSRGLDTDISQIVECISARDGELSRREARGRIVLLELLLNMFFTTAWFREVMSEKMEESLELERKRRELGVRARKTGETGCDGSGSECGRPRSECGRPRSEAERDAVCAAREIFKLPTRVVLGEIGGIRFLNLGKRIYAAKEGEYYLVGRDALVRLCKRYRGRSKGEKATMANIEQHVEALQM